MTGNLSRGYFYIKTEHKEYLFSFRENEHIKNIIEQNRFTRLNMKLQVKNNQYISLSTDDFVIVLYSVNFMIRNVKDFMNYSQKYFVRTNSELSFSESDIHLLNDKEISVLFTL